MPLDWGILEISALGSASSGSFFQGCPAPGVTP